TALFIKIQNAQGTSSELVTETRLGEVYRDQFDANASVGIAEIRIFGEEGELPIAPPLSVAGSVTPSSVLQPADAYRAAHLFDSRKEFVWAEGATGVGIGETLTFTFDEAQKVSAIKIWNGYQRSPKHFS